MDAVTFTQRRQFCLGPEFLAVDGWNCADLPGGHRLASHPDLGVHRVDCADASLTLIGYLVDPDAPDADEAAVLAAMVARAWALDDVIADLERMSGRFALVVTLPTGSWLLHDAAGLRQVLYCRHQGQTWCASQAETLATRFGFEADQAVLAYASAPVFAHGKAELWLPDDQTPYREVHQLLANHYLDLSSGQVTRFWPGPSSIPHRSIDEAIARTGPVLRRTIVAMAAKQRLIMGISAGMDSRESLAAARPVRDQIDYFTIEHRPGSVSVDVAVPSRLLPELGLNHTVVDERAMDPEFLQFFEASATFARAKKGNNAYTAFRAFGADRTNLISNLAEISQCYYWLPRSHLDGAGLALVTGLDHPLAAAGFDRWLRGARAACDGAGLNVLSLFYWEQKCGRWAAAAFSEYDLVHESFVPYNNRRLLADLLGTDERRRRDGMWDVSRRQIQALWPEVLVAPINPETTPVRRVREYLRRRVLHRFVTPRLPIYEYVKFLHKQLKARRPVR